jgi:hypothetical protein
MKVDEKEADFSIRQIGMNKNRWRGSSFYTAWQKKSKGSKLE